MKTEHGSGSPLDGLADKYGTRWGAPDEMGWSFEQSAFTDFCAEFAAAIRASISGHAQPVGIEPTSEGAAINMENARRQLSMRSAWCECGAVADDDEVANGRCKCCGGRV